MKKAATPEVEIRALLDELHHAVTTREKVQHFREVRRGKDRRIAVMDWVEHVTKGPGLLAQLGVAQARPATVAVEVSRWERTDCPCDKKKTARCRHDRRVPVRIEHRTVPGVVTTGAAYPGGSPGWDADGALAPLTGGSADPGEPVTEAWHAAQQIYEGLHQLGRDLCERGHEPPATLITIAMADPEEGARIARRLRGLVNTARIAAAYDAPPVRLRGVCCPLCGGELVRRGEVASDHAAVVLCNGVVPGPALVGEDWPIRCGARWPRADWVRLLAEVEDQAS